jgi:hypothetical protein
MAGRTPLSPLAEDGALTESELLAGLPGGGGRGGSGSRGASSAGAVDPSVYTLAYEDIVLGPAIGAGAYGKVYRGTWRGTEVAVKAETVRHRDLAKYLASEIATLG